MWLVLLERTMACVVVTGNTLQGMGYGGCPPQSVSLVLSWVHASQNAHKLKVQGLGRVVKLWNTLLRGMVESPSLEVLKKYVGVESDTV